MSPRNSLRDAWSTAPIEDAMYIDAIAEVTGRRS
jgi:hypothetical protein